MNLKYEGVDYAWADKNYDALKSAGKKFAMRYISNDPTKDLSGVERDKLWAKGIAVGLVFETSAGRALSGRGGGVADANKAKDRTTNLGLNDIPVYFAVDFDAALSQMDDIARYLDGAASVLGRARVGVYGSYSVVERMAPGKAKWLWQTYAWSGGKVSSKAHVLQYKNGVTIGGMDCDLDKASTEGLKSLRGKNSDVLTFLTKGERKLVLRLEKYRANASKRGKWIDSERHAAEKIKVEIGNIIDELQRLDPDKENRRERLNLLRDARANRTLEI